MPLKNNRFTDIAVDSYSHLVLDVSLLFTLQLTTVDRWEKVNPDESVETDV